MHYMRCTYSGAYPFTFSGDIRSLSGDSDIHHEERERARQGIRAGRLALAAVAIRQADGGGNGEAVYPEQ
jgi:hypothetical protein